MKLRLTTTAIAVAAVFPMYVPTVVAQDSRLDTVVVTATRQAQRVDEVLASVDVITREEIERSGHSTLSDLLASRPGIQVATNGGPGSKSSVFIRGANSDQSLLLIDGMRVGSATNGAPTLEMIPLALINRIEILRGPASALYGSDAIGGVIQIFTRKGDAGVQPSLRVGVGTQDTYTASAGVAGGIERLRYNLVVGHDRTRGFDALPDSVSSADGDRDGFRNDYVSAAISLGLREQDEMGVSLFHSDGRNWVDVGREFDSFIDKRVESVGLHVRNHVVDSWTSTLKLAHSKDMSHTRSTAASRSEFDTSQRQFTWQNDIDLAGGSLLAAYEFLEQRIDTTGTFDKTKRTVNSAVLGWGGNFDRHSLQINARRDRNSQFGSETTGTAAYGYQFGRDLRVYGSIGTAFRAPTFNDLYFPFECFPPWGCFGGNTDLKPEEALNREIGLAWETLAFTASATYFNNRVKNLIVWGNVPENVGVARLEGVELGIGTELLGFNLRANYDYLKARDDRTGERLRRRATHSAGLAADRQSGAWRYGLEWNVQGKRDDLRADGSRVRLSGYGVTNLFVHYALARDWQLELHANNVFDKKYVLAHGFATARASAFVAVRYAPR